MSLSEMFEKYFLVELANTPDMKQKTYKIRYHVYCKEFKYEPIELFPDEKETDEYDDNSLHCIITHKTTGIPAACIRLIPASLHGEPLQLPFEKHCVESLDVDLIKQLELERKSKCEVSRLAVDSLFRKSFDGDSLRFSDVEMNFSKEEEQLFPLIPISAYLATIALSKLSDRTNVFAMMESSLPKLLQRSGILFRRVGKYIDYHGLRAPYFITAQTVLDNMKPELFELYARIYKQIESSYIASPVLVRNF